MDGDVHFGRGGNGDGAEGDERGGCGDGEIFLIVTWLVVTSTARMQPAPGHHLKVERREEMGRGRDYWWWWYGAVTEGR